MPIQNADLLVCNNLATKSNLVSLKTFAPNLISRVSPSPYFDGWIIYLAANFLSIPLHVLTISAYQTVPMSSWLLHRVWAFYMSHVVPCACVNLHYEFPCIHRRIHSGKFLGSLASLSLLAVHVPFWAAPDLSGRKPPFLLMTCSNSAHLILRSSSILSLTQLITNRSS